MKVIDRSITTIIPYDKNPRKNDEAVEYVARSIKEFGFKVPLIIDKDGVIVAGHTRYKAAQHLGIKSVPCIVADDLTPDQVKAFRLADNKTAELSGWDFTALEKELSEIADIEMTMFGFHDDIDPDVLNGLFEPAQEKEKDAADKKTVQCPHCGEWFEL